MQQEIWVEISGHLGYYISNFGRVRKDSYSAIGKNNYKDIIRLYCAKIKKLSTTALGYSNCGLNRKTYLVHRLVAIHFIPNPENKPQVNHKDGNPLNNSIENLEWATSKENINYSFNVLGRKNTGDKLRGRNGKRCVLSKCIGQFKDGELVAKYWGQDVQTIGGFNRNSVHTARQRMKPYMGYDWRFV